jgi:hypothetical protein
MDVSNTSELFTGYPLAHPLDGARLKIVRAEEHVDALKAEVAMYLHGRPWTIGTKVTGGHSHIAPIITVPPPLRLSTIIGDCVTNVRASLDYIIWELAGRYFSPPFDAADFNDRRITSFPISNGPTEAGYVDRLNRLAKRGVPTAAIDEIKAMQPHNRGYESLRWLHELVNTDKHRATILTLAYVPVFYCITGGGQLIAYGSGQFKTYKATSGEITMKMDDEVAITVTFQDVTMPREPVDRTLEQIIETAANIIPCFEPFFP